jgi:hypothetical protein
MAVFVVSSFDRCDGRVRHHIQKIVPQVTFGRKSRMKSSSLQTRATLLLFLLGSSTAFVPLRASQRTTSIQRHAEYGTAIKTTDDWVKQEFEESSPNLKDNCIVVVGPSRVLIYDTTLRDGTQGESVSASCGTYYRNDCSHHHSCHVKRQSNIITPSQTLTMTPLTSSSTTTTSKYHHQT